MRWGRLFLISVLVCLFAIPDDITAQPPDEDVLILLIDGDIWTVAPSNATFTRLTTNAHIQEFVLSPDGSRLATSYLSPVTVDAYERVGGFSGYPPKDIGFLYLDTGNHFPATEQPPDAALFEGPDKPDSAILRSVPAWAPGSEGLVWTEVHYPSFAPATNRLMEFNWQPGEPELVADNLPEQAGIPGPLAVNRTVNEIAVLSYEYEPGSGDFPVYMLIYNTGGALLGWQRVPDQEDNMGFLEHFVWDASDKSQLMLIYSKGALLTLDTDTLTLNMQPNAIPMMFSRLNPETSLQLTFTVDDAAEYGKDHRWTVHQPDGSNYLLDYYGHDLTISPDGTAVATFEGPFITIWWPDNTQPIALPDDLLLQFNISQMAWGPIAWTPQAVDTAALGGDIQPVSCPGTLTSRLIVGSTGRVIAGAGANNLRDQPGTTGTVIGQIPENGIFTVLAGPQCRGEYTWWQVDYTGIMGWTAEGDASTYWLEPFVE